MARGIAVECMRLVKQALPRAVADGQDLDRYLLAPDRIDYLDDFELVAFDEEMERGQALRA